MTPTTTTEPRITSYEPASRHRTLMKIGNAVMVPMLRSRFGARMHDLALLTVTGRLTGRRYAIPVAIYELDGETLVLTAAAWRTNLRGGADVELTRDGRSRPMHAQLLEEPDAVAEIYAAMLERIGVRHSVRVGLRVAGDAMPTHDELVAAIGGRRAVVRLTRA